MSCVHCAHLDLLQLQWQMQKHSESISQLCQNLQNIPHRLVHHCCAVLQSLVLLVASYEGKQPIRLQPLKGNAAPLQAAKTAKSSQNSVSNIDINTDVHTQTLPVPRTSTHTGTPLSFLSIMTFVLAKDCTDCLLLWSWPSWQGSCYPNSVGEVWNQTPSALAKLTKSTEAEWASMSENPNYKLISTLQMQHFIRMLVPVIFYCMPTV